MSIINSISAWGKEDLIRTTLSAFKRCKYPYQFNRELKRFINRLPNCNLEELKDILDKMEG